MLSNTMISYITQRMPWKGCLCFSIVSAFPCGRVKTIGIRHVWTRIFSKTEPIFVYKNTRILVHGALKKVQCHKKLHLSIVNGSIWWSNYLVTTQTRQVSKGQFTLLLSPRYISIRKRNVKQRRRRKREGLKKQCCSLHLVHFFAVPDRLRSGNAVFYSGRKQMTTNFSFSFLT